MTTSKIPVWYFEQALIGKMFGLRARIVPSINTGNVKWQPVSGCQNKGVCPL